MPLRAPRATLTSAQARALDQLTGLCRRRVVPGHVGNALQCALPARLCRRCVVPVRVGKRLTTLPGFAHGAWCLFVFGTFAAAGCRHCRWTASSATAACLLGNRAAFTCDPSRCTVASVTNVKEQLVMYLVLLAMPCNALQRYWALPTVCGACSCWRALYHLTGLRPTVSGACSG